MSLLTVKLKDVTPIDCGKRGVFKRNPRYRAFVLFLDSILIGKQERCLTYKEIFGGIFVTSKMHVKGRNKFLNEIFGPILDPWRREELLERMLSAKDEREEGEIVLSIVREEFDEVKFSNITGLTLRRHGWSGVTMIEITYQGGWISFAGCAFTPWGVQPITKITQDIFVSIQNGVGTYRRS